MNNALQTCVHVRVNSAGAVSRRGFLRNVAGLGLAAGGLRWSQSLSAFAGEMKKRGKSCILLWMAGGPSQFETRSRPMFRASGLPSTGPNSPAQ